MSALENPLFSICSEHSHFCLALKNMSQCAGAGRWRRDYCRPKAKMTLRLAPRNVQLFALEISMSFIVASKRCASENASLKIHNLTLEREIFQRRKPKEKPQEWSDGSMLSRRDTNVVPAYYGRQPCMRNAAKTGDNAFNTRYPAVTSPLEPCDCISEDGSLIHYTISCPHRIAEKQLET